MNFELTKRQGIIVWVYTLRQIKNLKRFGYIHYVSNRLKYVVMYVDQGEVKDKMERLNSLHYVRKVEISHRPEIDMTFEHALESDKEENLIEIENN
ncbi:YlbG family protein [Jeotgalibaca ciconiae]|uniref:UPF0298 protein EJN90_11280 n=1 Tax=Jeotgalibaca ciconiae TaxID=2496265 RepID=A0A3Q9BM92_9LACT|nr:YlbG family protein [Jeotgalibaca ciconiae]AZP05173.1 DUF2129 domain-containing protein [Jeotgalibaca ciconiae]